ncbi:MAG: hypothetical protein IKC94_05740 [Lentisphaeria bacterium]|nr:hypothetical protein [Lentisphaeria bacterium]
MSDQKTVEFDGIRLNLPDFPEKTAVEPEKSTGEKSIPVEPVVEKETAETAVDASDTVESAVEELEICLRAPVVIPDEPEAANDSCAMEESAKADTTEKVQEEPLENSTPETPAVPEASPSPAAVVPKVLKTPPPPSAALPKAQDIFADVPLKIKKAPVRAILLEDEDCGTGKKRRKTGCLIVVILLLLIAGGAGFVWWKHRPWAEMQLQRGKELVHSKINGGQSQTDSKESGNAAGETSEPPASTAQ